jgi:hypothetical protein
MEPLDVSSISMPEVARRTANPAPQLPGLQSKYFYLTPDATFNQSKGNLFSHLDGAESTDEFAYGEPNRLGTQSAYLNIPHTVSRTLMPLMLPSAKEAKYGNEPFLLPFPHLRKGDVAFHLRMEVAPCTLQDVREGRGPPLAMVMCHGNWAEVMQKRRKCGEMTVMASESSRLFVNLETVNYILHGIQHYRDTEPSWRDSFWRGFGLHRLDPLIANNAELLCAHVVRWCMAPFGVVVSENMHSSDLAVAMIVDGRVERMRNYWVKQGSEDEDVEVPQAGDELIFMLERREMRLDEPEALEEELQRWAHVLPSFLAGYDAVKMVFPIKRAEGIVIGPAEKKHWIWQLVPGVKSAGNRACWEGRGFFTLGRVY